MLEILKYSVIKNSVIKNNVIKIINWKSEYENEAGSLEINNVNGAPVSYTVWVFLATGSSGFVYYQNRKVL